MPSTSLIHLCFFLFVLFICSDLACLHCVTEPPVSKQLDMLLLCVEDQTRLYYYEVDHATGSMKDVLEFLRTHFKCECNARAERVTLVRTVQHPCQALLDYASTIRLNARHFANPDSFVHQSMCYAFAAGMSTEPIATKLVMSLLLRLPLTLPLWDSKPWIPLFHSTLTLKKNISYLSYCYNICSLRTGSYSLFYCYYLPL